MAPCGCCTYIVLPEIPGGRNTDGSPARTAGFPAQRPAIYLKLAVLRACPSALTTAATSPLRWGCPGDRCWSGEMGLGFALRPAPWHEGGSRVPAAFLGFGFCGSSMGISIDALSLSFNAGRCSAKPYAVLGHGVQAQWPAERQCSITPSHPVMPPHAMEFVCRHTYPSQGRARAASGTRPDHGKLRPSGSRRPSRCHRSRGRPARRPH